MGISPGNLHLMMSWANNGWLKPKGNILDIGAQELFCTTNPSVLNSFLAHFGGDPYDEATQARLANQGMASEIMQRAGFGYAALDFKPYPFSVLIDLNRERLPSRHRGCYDLVTNIGTSEHILNQWNVFEVMHDATAVGGLMHHGVPCCGEFEHGILNYNAKFWWALEEANGYRRLLFSAWIDGELKQVPAGFADTIIGYRPTNWRAPNGWMNILFQKLEDRPFAGLVDQAFR